MLRHFKNVTVVGENSAGGMHFIDPGFFQLPRSKLVVQFGTFYLGFKDHHLIEKKGLTPYLKSPQGKDARTWLLEKINDTRP